MPQALAMPTREFIEQNSEAVTETGCWIWMKGLSKAGYGNLRRRGKKDQGGLFLTHRLAYEIFNGAIQEGMHILHKCDVRACCNPNHLIAGTNTDNITDMFSKKRNPNRAGDLNGRHLLNEIQVKEIKSLYNQSKAAMYKKDLISHSQLAKLYNVSKSCISAILKGRNWKNAN